MLIHKHKINQKDKHKIRNDDAFKKLKKRLIEKCGSVDYITGTPLIQDKATCHHLDMDPENYSNFSNEDNFIMLNEGTHRLLHQLFHYYKNDNGILIKLKEIMDKMLNIIKHKESNDG